MVERVRPKKRALLPTIPLLPTDSRQEFDRVLDAVYQELKPQNIIEKMFTEDIPYFAWEIQRIRRCKAGIIVAEFTHALASLLRGLVQTPGGSGRVYIGNETWVEAETLARQYFTDEEVKQQALEFLSQFQLDESAIEAEAVKRCASRLEKLDKLEASYEARLQKALRSVFEYRNEFGLRLRDAAHRIIEGKAIALEDSSKKDGGRPGNGN
jgi:hypothetical protein